MFDPRSLDPLFAPRSVAIIGASSDANKIGGRPLAFLRRAGYAGAIYPINPGATEVQSLQAYSALDAIDAPVEQAIIAVAPQHALAAMRACAAASVRAVQVFSAGFAEVGQEGLQIQAELLAIARAAGIRVLGPNSLGLFNVAHRFFGTFATALDGAWPAPGDVGFASQSGAFGSYCYALAQARGLGFSHFVATGNEGDVDVAECIAYLAQDPHTAVIVATFEGCRDGRRLMAALALARARRKPVIVMKAGASAAGAQAAATHTGSLAGADAVYDGVFRQFNAYRAHSIDELVDVVYALARGNRPRSSRLGVVTTSGGIGVLVADAASQHGLALPALGADAAGRVKAILPYASAANPLDTSAALIGDLSLFAQAMSILIESAACDIVLGYLAHVGRNPRHYGQLREPLFALRARHPEKMFVVCMLCPPDVREELEAQGLLVFEEPTRAVIAIAAAAAITRGLSRNDEPAAAARPVDLPRRKLNETEAKDVLRQAGIATLPERVVRSGDEARRVAAAMETPVAMKIVSAQVAHKSDVGGVRLNVASADEADRTYDELIAAVGRAAPHAKLDGVLVTPMLQGGVETILGVVRDPVFGPVVMFGSGGVLVELTNDVAFRAAPFGKEVAGEMIDQTLAAKLLRGVRGARPADRDALVRTLTRLADFASTNADRLDSIDINPYVVLPKGGVALDAVVVPRLESQ